MISDPMLPGSSKSDGKVFFMEDTGTCSLKQEPTETFINGKK